MLTRWVQKAVLPLDKAAGPWQRAVRPDWAMVAHWRQVVDRPALLEAQEQLSALQTPQVAPGQLAA
jgi:hypothetical protein